MNALRELPSWRQLSSAPFHAFESQKKWPLTSRAKTTPMPKVTRTEVEGMTLVAVTSKHGSGLMCCGWR